MPNMHFYGNFKQNPKFLKFELLPPPQKKPNPKPLNTSL